MLGYPLPQDQRQTTPEQQAGGTHPNGIQFCLDIGKTLRRISGGNLDAYLNEVYFIKFNEFYNFQTHPPFKVNVSQIQSL